LAQYRDSHINHNKIGSRSQSDSDKQHDEVDGDSHFAHEAAVKSRFNVPFKVYAFSKDLLFSIFAHNIIMRIEAIATFMLTDLVVTAT
jgi:hypothetical protein